MMVFRLLSSLFEIVVMRFLICANESTTASLTYTDSEHMFTGHLGIVEGKNHIVHFHSKQIRHCLNYKQWWIRNKARYTYEVTIHEYLDGELVRQDSAVFPQMCRCKYSDATYPHLCAIHAYFDIYKHWKR